MLSKLKALSQDDLVRVHEASLKILAETGVVFHNEEALEIYRKHGAKVVDKTVYFTREMVEKALETCPTTFRWRGRNAERSVTVGEGFLIQPNLGAVYIQDLDRGRRLGKLEDYANLQKLSQASDICTMVGAIPVDACDVKSEEKHLKLMYETIRNTDKPIVGFCCHGHQAREMLDMVELAMGEKDFLKENHCAAVSVNPLSPLAHSPEGLETIIEFAKRNQIIYILPCILAGVTGPVSLLGTAVLQNVEILSGIVLTQLINPGNPVVYAPASTAANMKRASYITGTPEMMLINMANIQMALEYYHLPTRTMCGMTDAKTVDCQAGYETMQNLMMGMLSGAHIVYQNMGVLDAIMATSYEKFIIDEEIIKRVMRISQGMDTSDKALSIDVIQEVGSAGSYLTHTNTFEHFRSLWTPSISDWDSYEDWEKAGSEDVVVRANKKYKEILQNAPETLIDAELDNELKAFMDAVRKK